MYCSPTVVLYSVFRGSTEVTAAVIAALAELGSPLVFDDANLIMPDCEGDIDFTLLGELDIDVEPMLFCKSVYARFICHECLS